VTGGPHRQQRGLLATLAQERQVAMRPVRIVAAVVLTAAAAATGSYIARSTAHQSATPDTVVAAPGPEQPAPAPPGHITLPLGRVERLDAIQVVGTRTAWAVGKDTILTTSDGGRTWTRVWGGAHDLHDVDFVSTSTGWALGDGILLGTVDGGQHWRELGQPRSGPLRRVHFASRSEGWGVAGGTGQPGEGPQGPTTLVHTTDGGQTWSAMDAPAPPQSVCFTASTDGWLASGTSVWRSTDGGRGWGSRPSFTLPLPADGLPSSARLQCARPGAAWVQFETGDHAAGHSPYALYTSGDGGAHWRGVLGEAGTLGNLLRLPGGPGTYPGPFSVIDPERAFLLSPTPPADATGAVLIGQGSRLRRLPDIPQTTLSALSPLSVSFASATRGWVVGTNGAGRAVILATADGGRTWQSQLPS
jgi:photosystem II stability/assembly factor-like uncharacterized protein